MLVRCQKKNVKNSDMGPLGTIDPILFPIQLWYMCCCFDVHEKMNVPT